MAKKKVQHDGIWFDSKLEANHYFYFQQHPKIEIVEMQKRFLLLKGFDYFDIQKDKTRKARDMIYTCDFIIKHKDYDKPIAYEPHGYARKDYNNRIKLFRAKYPEYYFVESSSMKKTRELFGELKEVKV